jgi:CRISPR/Cas system CMR-associated protein Cmr1 (group 7 of RAMP superfamily)
MIGARIGNDIDALRVAESEVFGNTDGASPVTIQVSHQRDREKQLQIAHRRALPHSASKTFSAPAFVEDGEFVLRMHPRFGQLEIPEEAGLALRLLVDLGGAGKRTRRGFGSLQYAKAASVPDNGETLMGQVETLLSDVQNWVSGQGAFYNWTDQVPKYPILTDKHAKVLVCRQAIGHDHYHQAMVDFWDRLRQRKYVENERAFGYARGRRRASPLWLHIARSREGYHLVLTAFRSKPEPLGGAGWATLNQFLDECKSAWQGVYVLGGNVTW